VALLSGTCQHLDSGRKQGLNVDCITCTSSLDAEASSAREDGTPPPPPQARSPNVWRASVVAISACGLRFASSSVLLCTV
jgi:hypothetical protein